MKAARTASSYLLGVTIVASFWSMSVASRADTPQPVVTPSASAAPPSTPAASPPAAPPPEPLPAPASTPPTVSRRAVALGAAGVAAAAAVGAIVFGMLALQSKAAYEKTPTYANTDDGNNFAAYSDGCIALAVAGGVTSLVLFLTTPSSSGGGNAVSGPHAAIFSASPMLMAHGGGAGAVLRF